RCGGLDGTTRLITGTAVSIRAITPIGEPTVTAPGTTLTPAGTARREESMDRTVVLVSAHATTRARARIREARLPMDHTEHAARRKPTTRAPERMPRPVRVRTFTAIGVRRACSAAMIGSIQNVSPTVQGTRRGSPVVTRAA